MKAETVFQLYAKSRKNPTQNSKINCVRERNLEVNGKENNRICIHTHSDIIRLYIIDSHYSILTRIYTSGLLRTFPQFAL